MVKGGAFKNRKSSMKQYFLLSILISLILLGCEKAKENNTESQPSKGKMGVVFNGSDYFFHVIAVPLSIYIDHELKTVWNANTTIKDCYGRQVDFLIEAENGNHTFAFVSPDGHFVDGNMTIVADKCTYMILNEDQFSTAKTNYGTDKGRLTFIRTRLPMGNTPVYVNNNLIGTLVDPPFHALCGVANNGRNLVVDLSPGTYPYKAVDLANNIQWTGNVTVSPNSCTVIKF
jgi:hypothetical protein